MVFYFIFLMRLNLGELGAKNPIQKPNPIKNNQNKKKNEINFLTNFTTSLSSSESETETENEVNEMKRQRNLIKTQTEEVKKYPLDLEEALGNEVNVINSSIERSTAADEGHVNPVIQEVNNPRVTQIDDNYEGKIEKKKENQMNIFYILPTKFQLQVGMYYGFPRLLVVLLLFSFIIVGDILLFGLFHSKFTPKIVDIHLSDPKYDAKIVVEGDFQLASTFSTFDVLNPQCILSYSNAGKSLESLAYLTTTDYSFQRLGGLNDDSILVELGLSSTNYDNVNIFLWDALHGGTAKSFVYVHCVGQLQANVLTVAPVTISQLVIERWVPLNRKKYEQSLETSSVPNMSLSSSQTSKHGSYENMNWKFDSNLIEIFNSYFPHHLPPQIKFNKQSSLELEAEIHTFLFNPFKFVQDIPVVLLHIPSIVYSGSFLGHELHDERYVLMTNKTTINLAEKYLQLDLSLSFLSLNRTETTTKKPLVSREDAVQFLDNVFQGKLQIVWNSETPNFFTELFGLSHHLNVSTSTVSTLTSDHRSLFDDREKCIELALRYDGRIVSDAMTCLYEDRRALNWKFMLLDDQINSSSIRHSSKEQFLSLNSLFATEILLNWDSEHEYLKLGEEFYFSFRVRNGLQGVANALIESDLLNPSNRFVNSTWILRLEDSRTKYLEMTSISSSIFIDSQVLLKSESSLWFYDQPDPCAVTFGGEMQWKDGEFVVEASYNLSLPSFNLEKNAAVLIEGNYFFPEESNW
jgi:hypothetical protein